MTETEYEEEAAQADSIFKNKYAPLTKEYMDNVSPLANLEDVLSGKVSLADADHITNYSGNLSTILNASIRNGALAHTSLLKHFETGLAKALTAIPPHTGQAVYRMETKTTSIDLHQAYFNGKINEVMYVPDYLSTSKKEWVDKCSVIYEIKTLSQESSARDISRITNKADEVEVLFLPVAKLRILKVEERNNKLYVVMEETAHPATFRYNTNDSPAYKPPDDQEPGLLD
jgi:hypothetical protein